MRPPRFRSSSLAPRLEARAVALGLDASHSIAPGGEAVSPGHDGAWGQSPSEAASVTCWHGERRSDRHRPFLRPRAPGDAFHPGRPLGFSRGGRRGWPRRKEETCAAPVLRALRGLCCTVDSSPWSSADLNLNFSQYCRMEWISQKVPSCGRLPQNVNSPAFLSIALPFVLHTGINSSGLQHRSDSQSPVKFVGVPATGDGVGPCLSPPPAWGSAQSRGSVHVHHMRGKKASRVSSPNLAARVSGF